MKQSLDILVVDDEWLELTAICHLLRDDPRARVVGVASDGVEAVRLARQLNPDLVLMDIRMPGMDGLEAMGIIRESSPRTQVIIVTAFGEFEYARQALRGGASSYVLKPVTAAELGESITLILREMERQEAEEARMAGHLLRSRFDERTVLSPEDERALVEAITGGDAEAATRCCRNFVAAAVPGGRSTLQATLAELLWVLLRAAQTAEADLRSVSNLRGKWADRIVSVTDDEQGLICAGTMGAEFAEAVSDGWVSGTRRLVERARAYVDAHFNRDISLEVVADHVGLNPSYLSRAFSKEIGRPFVEYLTERRLEESQRLLRNPELTIDQISDRVGFSSAGYFSTVFRKRFGQTPSEVRRRKGD